MMNGSAILCQTIAHSNHLWQLERNKCFDI